MPLPKHYAIIDVETTGGDPRRDRITEVAIYRFDGEQVVDTFVSLVNPEMPIPNRITQVTGIDNDMVRDAPKFYEIAREVVEITSDAIFVGHNVRFDYGFIQKEFRSLGYTFSRKLLCTLKLARKRMPGHRSYSLKNICKRLNIQNEAAHRAWGDARATLTLLQRLLKKEDESLDDLKLEIATTKLPPNLSLSVVESLPDETGVYYFHDKQGRVLYAGKSTSVRKRIFSHFQAFNKTKRGMRLFEQLHDISFQLTGSELIALLLENEEIKRLLPPFNRAQRRQKFQYAILSDTTPEGYLHLWVAKMKDDPREVAYFSTRMQADAALKRKAEVYQLCPKLCELEQGPGRCFHHQLHLCRGACIQEEPAHSYNERAQQAIVALNYGRDNDRSYFIVDKGRTEDEQAVVCVEQGVYRGYAYLEAEFLQASPLDIRQAIPFKPEGPDVQRIIQGHLKKYRKQLTLIPYQTED